MAVGFPAKTTYATGDVLTATDVNDITGTLNLLQSTLYPAGRNKIINGDFGVWQRGTSFSTTVDMYTADRFYLQRNNTNTISRQTFTPGTAPVSGYEGQYFLRYARTTVGGGNDFLYQRIENVQTYAGQTVAVSFWAKADTAITIGAVQIDQIFGGGGSADVTVTAIGTLAVTTGWVRYSATVAIPSIAGKTIGTNSNLRVRINFTGAAVTFDTWGWQLEAASTGSTASPFQTASGSIGGELALCQRYYYRNTQTGVGIPITNTGGSLTTTLAIASTTTCNHIVRVISLSLSRSRYRHNVIDCMSW